MPRDRRREARRSTKGSKVKVSNGPTPFSDFGGRAKGIGVHRMGCFLYISRPFSDYVAILTKDYNVGHMFTLSFPNSSGMGLTATGLQWGRLSSGAISTVYKCENTSMVMKIDSGSSVKMNVAQAYILGNTKFGLSFEVLDHKSGMLSVQYTHRFAAMSSTIGLNSTPIVALSSAIGTKDLSLGGRITIDIASASFKKLAAGIAFDKPDFSASLTLEDRGQMLKGSYVHVLPNKATNVAAEMTHKFSSHKNSFTFGSAHNVNPTTVVKARFSDTRKIAILCQHEWRQKSQVTFLAEYDTKSMRHPKFGLTLSLKP